MLSISNSAKAGDPGDDLAERILRAAELCVKDLGIDRVTIAEIARRARVSRPTVYRRWPDVHAILAATVARRVMGILRDIPRGEVERTAIVDRSVTAVTRLRHDPLVEAGLRSKPAMSMRYVADRLGAGQLVLIEMLSGDLKEAQSRGSVRAGDCRQMAAMMMLMAQAAVQSAGMVAPILDEAQLDAELARAMNRYLS